mgnify:CR=1 FL=1
MEFDVLSIVQMIGGLALFIYGMTTMGKGLERAAGSKLEKISGKNDGQRLYRSYHGHGRDDGHSVLVCDDGHGGRLC